MKEKKQFNGLSDKTSDVVLVIITAIVVLIVAYPLYYVLVASVSNPYDVYAGKTFLFPSEFTLRGYSAVFADPNIFSGYLNSIKYTVIGTIFSVAMLYITAYPLAQKDLPGRKFTTDWPGCRETVQEGVNGYLAEPRDVDSLENAIRKYLSLSSEEKFAFGMASRKLALDRFDVNEVVEYYESLLPKPVVGGVIYKLQPNAAAPDYAERRAA